MPLGVRKPLMQEPAGHRRCPWGFRVAADVRGGATVVDQHRAGCRQTASLRLRAVLLGWRAAVADLFGVADHHRRARARCRCRAPAAGGWRAIAMPGSWPLLPVRCSDVRRPSRLPPSLEHLDHDHPAATAREWRADVIRFGSLIIRRSRRGWHSAFYGRAPNWPCVRRWRASHSGGCDGSHYTYERM